MFVIKENSENILEIKKSKFITKLYKVKSIDEVNCILDNLHKIYSDATHICYAYRIDDDKKFSDDGEPGGTAGMPMMDVIIKKDLNYILAVVIRYFGGIKLGSGGLVRAYSKAVGDALKIVRINTLENGYLIKIITSYDKAKKLDYIIKELDNVKKEYLEDITYIFSVNYELFDKLKEWNPIIIERILIEKELS